MPLVFAGDEAGDLSFSFDKGASTHFVLALVSSNQPDSLCHMLTTVRSKRGLPDSYEFKFHKLSGAALRQTIFEALRLIDFGVWALSVDKRMLPTYWQGLDAHDFYALLATELLLSIPLEYREDSTLMLDEFDPRGRALLALKRSLKRRGERRGFRKMTNVRSRSEPLVQVADLAAGSILRSLAHNDPETLSFIRSHIRLWLKFDARYKNPPS